MAMIITMAVLIPCSGIWNERWHRAPIAFRIMVATLLSVRMGGHYAVHAA